MNFVKRKIAYKNFLEIKKKNYESLKKFRDHKLSVKFFLKIFNVLFFQEKVLPKFSGSFISISVTFAKFFEYILTIVFAKLSDNSSEI